MTTLTNLQIVFPEGMCGKYKKNYPVAYNNRTCKTIVGEVKNRAKKKMPATSDYRYVKEKGESFCYKISGDARSYTKEGKVRTRTLYVEHCSNTYNYLSSLILEKYRQKLAALFLLYQCNIKTLELNLRGPQGEGLEIYDTPTQMRIFTDLPNGISLGSRINLSDGHMHIAYIDNKKETGGVLDTLAITRSGLKRARNYFLRSLDTIVSKLENNGGQIAQNNKMTCPAEKLLRNEIINVLREMHTELDKLPK